MMEDGIRGKSNTLVTVSLLHIVIMNILTVFYPAQRDIKIAYFRWTFDPKEESMPRFCIYSEC
jgi:hypothetical protein